MMARVQKVRVVGDDGPSPRITGKVFAITVILLLIGIIGTVIYHDRQKAIRDCVAGKTYAGEYLENIDQATDNWYGDDGVDYEAEDSYADLEYECKNGG